MCRFFFLFKVVEKLFPAINPEDLKKAKKTPKKREKRIRPKVYKNYKMCKFSGDTFIKPR